MPHVFTVIPVVVVWCLQTDQEGRAPFRLPRRSGTSSGISRPVLSALLPIVYAVLLLWLVLPCVLLGLGSGTSRSEVNLAGCCTRFG